MNVLSLVDADDIREFIKKNYSTKNSYHVIVIDNSRYVRFDIKPKSLIHRLFGRRKRIFVDIDKFTIYNDITGEEELDDSTRWQEYIAGKDNKIKPE